MDHIRKTIDIPLLKRVMIFTFICGLISHGFCYFNADFSHDSLMDVYNYDPAFMISVGRFVRPIYIKIFGQFALPALAGFFELLFLGISIFLLLDAVKIRNRYSVIVACGVMVTNASITLLNATNIHDAGAYALSLMLSSMGVWVALKMKHGIWFSIPLFFLSLGIYQAFINVAVFMFLIVAALDILDGQIWKAAWKKMFQRLAAAAASMILYYVSYKAILAATGVVESDGYNAVASVHDQSASAVIGRLVTAASTEVSWFTHPQTHSAHLVCLLNIICLFTVVFLVIRIAKARHIGAGNGLVLFLTLLAMPIGMNLIGLLSDRCHALVIYSFCLSYIFLLALVETAEEAKILSGKWFGEKKAMTKVALVIMAVMIFENCIYSNEVYLIKNLEYNATLSVMTRVIDRIEQTDGYELGKTKVAIVGRLPDSPMNKERIGKPEGEGLWHEYSVTYYETYRKYFEYILGYKMNLITEEESDRIAKQQAVKAMNCFPDKDSVQMIDDVLVVKFSKGKTNSGL